MTRWLMTIRAQLTTEGMFLVLTFLVGKWESSRLRPTNSLKLACLQSWD